MWDSHPPMHTILYQNGQNYIPLSTTTTISNPLFDVIFQLSQRTGSIQTMRSAFVETTIAGCPFVFVIRLEPVTLELCHTASSVRGSERS